MQYGLVKEKAELEISVWIYPLFGSKLPNILKCWIILSHSHCLIYMPNLWNYILYN